MRDEGTKIQKGPTGLTLQTQTTPSPSLAFVKESIDILRTMIKELDHQAKAKTTPRKVIYVDSEKEALNRSEGSLQRQRTITSEKVKWRENGSQAKQRARRKKSKLKERRSKY
ncbi:hypothetical protein Tco_1100695 [Tanacetum coccineum]